MIKKVCKEVKKSLTKKNITIFCIVFIFLFSGLLSIMLYGTGNDLLAEYEKSDFVYPEESTQLYREELENEAEAKIHEIMESDKEENVTLSEKNDDDVTIEEKHDSVTESEIEIPKDKDIKDVEEPKNDEHLGVDKDRMEEDASRVDEKLNTFAAPEA